MIFGELESGISLFERLSRVFKAITSEKETLVSTRIIEVCEANGVNRNQIPRVIGHGITLKDVQTDERLLEALSEEAIAKFCSDFNIRRAWLDGADDQIYPTYDFYKDLSSFEEFIDELSRRPEGNVSGLLLDPVNAQFGDIAVLLIQETFGEINGRELYRYYICNNWHYSYWKARAYLTACIALCWKRQIYVFGRAVDKTLSSQVASAKLLLGWGGEGFWEIDGRRWNAEDLALVPEVFLDGVDPGESEYGIRSGLELWLKLYDDGYMYCDLPNKGIRERFQGELHKR